MGVSSESGVDVDGGHAGDSANATLRGELSAAVLLVAGILCGPVAAWYAIDWAVDGLRDLVNVPDLSPIPIKDRKPGVPGPTFTYWLSWAIPPAVVYGIGGLLFWRKKSTRLFVSGFMARFFHFEPRARSAVHLYGRGRLRAGVTHRATKTRLPILWNLEVGESTSVLAAAAMQPDFV